MSSDRIEAGADSVIHMRGVRKVYRTSRVEVEALRGIDLDIRKADFVAIVGPSGSGKSTLMNIIGCLDMATEGTYRLGGELIADMDRNRLADVRNRRVGFVFQGFHLLPHISARQNVELPLIFAGVPARQRRSRVAELLELVGLAHRTDHRPGELSGGEMQRVAVARALAVDPDLLLADEPTGNLDTETGLEVLALFEDLWRRGHTVVLVTHDAALAARARRRVTIRDGRIEGAPEPV